jgi:hypothetical protein
MPKYKIKLVRGTDETAIVDVESSSEHEAIQAAMNIADDVRPAEWDVESVEVVE